ncbi:Caffeyl-CoA reductase-Etf complex subunit CarD [archaeon HR01]|nr:Caffeyl-CoA reductase-Etf complex subunit CarD [archaeon HR01]
MPDIVVCVKQTVDVYQLKPHPETLEPVFSQAQSKISDFDLNALEEALRIREKGGGRVSVVSAGPSINQLLIRETLAMGADEAHIISHPLLSTYDGRVTATVLSKLVEKAGRWDLILCGEASLDNSDYQTGPRLAEIFGVPHLAYVTKLEISDGRLKAWKSMEDGLHVASCSMPAVVTVGLEINTPRLPSLLMIRAATKKPIHEYRLSDLGLTEEELNPSVTLRELKALKVERRRVKLEGKPEELAEKLADILVREALAR